MVTSVGARSCQQIVGCHRFILQQERGCTGLILVGTSINQMKQNERWLKITKRAQSAFVVERRVGLRGAVYLRFGPGEVDGPMDPDPGRGHGGGAFCRLLWSDAPSSPSALPSAHQPQRNASRVPAVNASGLLSRRKLLLVRQLPPPLNRQTATPPSTTLKPVRLCGPCRWCRG